MKELLGKFIQSITSEGLLATLRKVVLYITEYSFRKKYKAMIDLPTTSERFTEIYKSKLWRDNESVSGPGSTLETTKNLRSTLPILFEDYGIKTVLDAPCGDFNWMKEVVKNRTDINYIGGDIVQDLVNKNNENHSSDNIRFQVIDIIKDPLPVADLMIVRDCLFHLSFKDIETFLSNFAQSGIKYLMTTTHIMEQGFQNTDIVTGHFRLIDIFSQPINLPDSPLLRIADYVYPDPEREMCLFSAAQIQALTRQDEKVEAPELSLTEH